MSKRVRSTKQLPDWFNLNKYSHLTIEKPKELIAQLNSRTYLLNSAEGMWGEFDPEDYEQWSEITEAGTVNKPELHIRRSFKELDSAHSITPLDLMSAWWFGERAKNALGIIDDPESDSVLIPNEPNPQLRLLDTEECGFTDSVTVSIDLSYSNKQILKELEALLPSYRDTLNLPEPESIFKPSDAIKILEYQAIPYLDLKIWEALEDKQITNSVLAVALFPDGSKGEYEIRTTIQKFISRIRHSLFTTEWDAHINSE